MDIQKKIIELKGLLITHQTEMGYHVFDGVLMILAWMAKNIDQNTDMIDKQGERSDHHIALINGLMNIKPRFQEELKPCAHCNMLQPHLHHVGLDDAGNVYYWCSGCGMRTADYPTEKEARNMWQRRSNV